MTQAATSNNPVGFRENTVAAHDFQVRYHESGEGDPVVVLHGAGGVFLTRTEQLLAEKYRVIVLEMPGFGGTKNESSKSVAELALTVDQAVANLGIDKYHLMGYSFGTKVALWIALQRPERLEGLVLVAPIAFQPDGGLRQPASDEEREKMLFAHPERRPDNWGATPEIAASNRAFLQRINGLAPDEEITNRLSEIELPTLVIFGTADKIVSPDLARHYKERMKNCNVMFVYDAAHAVHSDRPEALSGLVADYVERHEVFVVSRESTLRNP